MSNQFLPDNGNGPDVQEDAPTTHTVYHGSPYKEIDKFRVDNLRNRTGTPGTLSFTIDPEVAKIYGDHVHKVAVTGKFGDYTNSKHVGKVFDWRDKSPLQQGTYRRVAEHFAPQGPKVVQEKLEEARLHLLRDIADGHYSLWENVKMWHDLGWDGAWAQESGGHNLIVGKNAAIRKLDNPE